MISDIMLGQYLPGDSILHRLDPRSKIIATFIFISSIFLADGYASYGVLTAFVVLATALGKISPRLMIRSVRPLWVILAFTLVIHMLTTSGTVLYSAKFITITQEGLRQGLMMSMRLILLILMSSLLTFTTSPIALTDGIETLLGPFKRIGLPAHELAMMMTIALRFIPTLLEETERIMKAQMARGADFSTGNPIRRAKSMVPLLVPLFISAFRRADELAIAMEARCYRGGESRTRMKELKQGLLDVGAYAASLVLVAVLALLKWKPGGWWQ